jgi:hypothetical protein
MKKFLLGIFLLLFQRILIAQVSWSLPILVSGGDAPYFAIDRKTGNLHVVSMWDGAIYTLMDSLGNPLLQETINDDVYDAGGMNYGAVIAVDNMGFPHVCYRRILGDWRYDVIYSQKSEAGWSFMPIATNVLRGSVVRLAIDDINTVHIGRSIANDTPYGSVIYDRIFQGSFQQIQTDLEPYRVDNRFELCVGKDRRLHLLLGYPNINNSSISYYRTDITGRELIYVADIHSSECVGRNGSPDVFADTSGNIHMCYGTSADLTREGNPSVRYVRYAGNVMVRNVAVTDKYDLDTWKEGDGWGIGSVAASDDGKYVVVAYLTSGGSSDNSNAGDLFIKISSDRGATWDVPVMMASSVGGSDGRNTPLIRAFKNHFYLIYPNNSPKGIRLRMIRHLGDPLPVAHAGGPYTGIEGDSILFDGSGSIDEGQNAGIVKYTWDWENDAVFDYSTSDPLTCHVYKDDYTGKTKLRVEDRAQRYNDQTANVQIYNVPPNIDAGEDRIAHEGDTLTFFVNIKDPGLDEHTIEWKFSSGSSKFNQQVKHIYYDEGTFQTVVTVEDDDGGFDKDTVNVTILNANPVADAGGPYHSVIDVPVTFYGESSDPGIYDFPNYWWDLDGDRNFEVEGKSVIVSYSEVGTYQVFLRVDDGDGGTSTDSATVAISNLAPVIGTIQNQVVDEGGTFTPLILDDYVDDPDQEDYELIWSFYGNTTLNVTLNNHVLQVEIPHSEWFGQDSVTLVVQDSGELRDTTEVVYIVNPVNDPPHWDEKQNYSLNEDDSLTIPLSFLRSNVVDIDDDLNDLRFSIAGNQYVKWIVEPVQKEMAVFSEKDWHGTEWVSFIVSDTTGASDSYDCKIQVESVGDLPKPFYLIEPIYASYSDWPDTLSFRWHRSSDPDSGSVLLYVWTLKEQGAGSGAKMYTHSTLDTVYHLVSGDFIEHGTYFWWVDVHDQTDSSARSPNEGIVIVGRSAIEEETAKPPQKFQLLQNYPNPFNAQTMITYHLPKASHVRLQIYNPLGQIVRVLEDGMKEGGIHSVTWDGRDHHGQIVPTGIYFCRFEAGDFNFYQKMILIQ